MFLTAKNQPKLNEKTEMPLTKTGICSRALLKIGAETIASFDEDTSEAVVVSNTYPGVLDSLLSSYPWTFATAQVRLPRLTKHLPDFAYSYQLPKDFLRALDVETSGEGQRGVVYRIQDGALHTDIEDVILTYIFRPDETDFPSYFTQALITFSAAEFCIPLTENPDKAGALLRIGEKELQQARNIDANQS